MARMDLDILQVFDAAESDPLHEEWMWESVNIHHEYAYAVRQGFPNSKTDPVIDRRPPRSNSEIPLPSGRTTRIVEVIHLREHSRPYVNGGYSFAPDSARLHQPQVSTAEDWQVEWGGRGCSAPWDLEDCGPERMITRERWHNLQHQHVVLRRGQRWWVITAAAIPEELGPFASLKPGLALGSVNDLQLRQVRTVLEENRVFRAHAQVDPADYVASIELVGPDDIGRARFGAMPPPLTDGFGVSDLALLDPLFESGSMPLEQALLPSAEVPTGSYVGLYFELYGLEEGEELDFSLTSERINPSFFQRLARFFHLASPETPQALTWEEPGEDISGVTRRFYNFDLGNLSPGEYELRLEVRCQNGREAEVSRRLRVR